MLLRIECRELGGWPVLQELPMVTQCKDGIRIQNFALTVNESLKTVCKKQRELTKLAKAGGKIRTSTKFQDLLLEALLGKPLDEFVNEIVEERTKDLREEIESLKRTQET